LIILMYLLLSIVLLFTNGKTEPDKVS
jgi:hypothetical protein